MGRDHSDRRTEQLRHAKRQIRSWERAHSTRNLPLRRRYNAALGRIRVLRAGGAETTTFQLSSLALWRFDAHRLVKSFKSTQDRSLLNYDKVCPDPKKRKITLKKQEKLFMEKTYLEIPFCPDGSVNIEMNTTTSQIMPFKNIDWDEIKININEWSEELTLLYFHANAHDKTRYELYNFTFQTKEDKSQFIKKIGSMFRQEYEGSKLDIVRKAADTKAKKEAYTKATEPMQNKSVSESDSDSDSESDSESDRDSARDTLRVVKAWQNRTYRTWYQL